LRTSLDKTRAAGDPENVIGRVDRAKIAGDARAERLDEADTA